MVKQMARDSSYIDEERVKYFEDEWLEIKSYKSERNNVIDEQTAIEFITKVFKQDSSLTKLAEHEEKLSKPYGALLKGSFIQNLIEDNVKRLQLGEVAKSQVRLDKSLELLKRRRIALEGLLPKKRSVTRRKVISLVMTNRVLNSYGLSKTVNKRKIIQYRSSKTGRFVSNKELLGLADKIIIASATKRKAVEKAIRKDFLGRKK